MPRAMRYWDGADGEVSAFWNIKLWEMSTEELKKPGREGLLPLMPFTKDGNRREVLEDMIVNLKATGRHNLLYISKVLAGKIFKSFDEQMTLKEVFTMVQEFLKDSWVYQETKEEGRQEGKIEEAGKVLRTYIKARFPELLSLADQQVQQVKTLDTLNKAIEELFEAQTMENAQQILLHLIAPKGTA